MTKCLYCLKKLDTPTSDFHEHCSSVFFNTKQAPILPHTLREMQTLSERLVAQRTTITGVQPKISLSYIQSERPNEASRLTIVGILGGQYILKTPSEEFAELPANEHITMKIAQHWGISVVPHTLIRMASGELAYLTRRIDRTASGEKIHQLDMLQVMDIFDKYQGSVERIGKALTQHSAQPLFDKIRLFELLVFCFLTGNSDMHLKNFSMHESPSGWVLTPAYDLLNVAIVLHEDEESALTIGGKKQKLQKTQFDNLAASWQLTERQIQNIYKNAQKKRSSTEDLIRQSFLSPPLQSAYIEVLHLRYERLAL